ncbi:hypothetical protein MAR_012723, partial [Mya arenaria]
MSYTHVAVSYSRSMADVIHTGGSFARLVDGRGRTHRWQFQTFTRWPRSYTHLSCSKIYPMPADIHTGACIVHVHDGRGRTYRWQFRTFTRWPRLCTQVEVSNIYPLAEVAVFHFYPVIHTVCTFIKWPRSYTQ